MMDQYSRNKGYTIPGMITGKPLLLGGSLGRNEATARGLQFCVREAAKATNLDLAGATVVVQGYGNAGAIAARLLAGDGAKILAVSDSQGGIYSSEGIDPANALRYKQEHGSLDGFPRTERVSNAELLEIACDVLVPAALENQITGANAGRIKARMVAEAANGPTTPEADRIRTTRACWSCPISWPTPAESRCRTSSGRRTYRATTGPRKRSTPGCSESCCARSGPCTRPRTCTRSICAPRRTCWPSAGSRKRSACEACTKQAAPTALERAPGSGHALPPGRASSCHSGMPRARSRVPANAAWPGWGPAWPRTGRTPGPPAASAPRRCLGSTVGVRGGRRGPHIGARVEGDEGGAPRAPPSVNSYPAFAPLPAWSTGPARDLDRMRRKGRVSGAATAPA